MYKGPDDYGIVAVLGVGAVLFFFLLSGYVLGRSLTRSPATSVRSFAGFAVRRVFRLYPAIIFALLAYAFATMVAPLPAYKFTSGKTLWFAGNAFTQDFSWWLQEVFLLKFQLVPVMWTLRAELVCSLVLPLMVALTPRVGIGAVCLAILFAWGLVFSKSFGAESGEILLFVATSLRYIFVFYLGFLLYRLEGLFRHIGQKLSWGLVVLALGVLALFSFVGSGLYWPQLWLQIPMTCVLALLLAVLIPCRMPRLKVFLLSRPLLFLGRCSYSVYLLHGLAIYAGLHLINALLPDRWPPEPLTASMVLLFVAWPLTVGASAICERFIERPLNLLGHRLGAKIADGPA